MKRLIDAYELIQDIEDNAKEFDCTGQSSAEMIDFVSKRIKLQKTVIYVSDDVKNIVTPDKHGRWIEGQCFNTNGVSMAAYTCTCCGHVVERERLALPAYCEFCGAKMEVNK